MAPIIQVEDLTYTYDGEMEPILRGLSLQIEEGESVLLLGDRGKSTLLWCLTGAIPQLLGGTMEGAVRVDGLSTEETPLSEMAKGVGIVFQDPEAQLVNLFVEDELAFGCENLLIPVPDILGRIEKYLELTGMSHHRSSYCHLLSGGEKQRTALASVLALEPRVLMLDEPTSNLDPKGTREFMSLVRELIQSRSKTIVMVEHNLDHVIDLIDRVIVLDDGRLVESGPPGEIFARHASLIRDRLGAWLPQASLLALALVKPGAEVTRLPTVVSDPILQKLAVDVEETTEGDGVAAVRDEAPVLVVRGLSHAYVPGYPSLEGIAFELTRGELVAVVGPNGGGKSTLTKHLVGLIKSPPGVTFLDGTDIRQLTPREIASKVGYVFQYPDKQFVTPSVFDEVAYGLRTDGVSEEEMKPQVDSVLRVMGLDGLEQKHPLSLSMGQKRRLSIGTALVLKPQLLVLDEPTMGMNSADTSALFELLRDLAQKGTCVLIVTHNMNVVARWADRALVLSRGRLIFSGSPFDLFSDRDVLDEASLEAPPLHRLAEQLSDDGRRGSVRSLSKTFFALALTQGPRQPLPSLELARV